MSEPMTITGPLVDLEILAQEIELSITVSANLGLTKYASSLKQWLEVTRQAIKDAQFESTQLPFKQ